MNHKSLRESDHPQQQLITVRNKCENYRNNVLIQDILIQLDEVNDSGQNSFIAATNKATLLENRISTNRIDELESKLTIANNQVEAVSKQLVIERDKSTNQSSELANLNEILIKCNEFLAQLKSENNKMENQLKFLRDDNEQLLQVNDELTIELDVAECTLKTMKAQHKDKTNQLKEKLTTKRDGQQIKITKLLYELDELNTRMNEMRENYDKIQNKLIERDAELRSLRERLQVSTPLRAKRADSMEGVLTAQLRVLTAKIDEMQTEKSDQKQTVQMHQELATILAEKKHLETQLGQCKEAEIQHDNDLQNARQEMDLLKKRLQSAHRQLGDRENNADIANKSLLEENGILKQQKAEIRCRLLEMQRNMAIERNRAVDETLDCAKMTIELDQLTKEMNTANLEKEELVIRNESLETNLADQQAMVTRLTTQCEQDLAVETAKFGVLKRNLFDMSKTNKHLDRAVIELDRQCEQLQVLRNTDKAEMDRKTEKCSELESLIQEMTAELDSVQLSLRTGETLVKEKEILEQKVAFLKEELKATTADYREELRNLAAQVAQFKLNKDDNKMETDATLMEDVNNINRKLETTIRCLERRLQNSEEHQQKSAERMEYLSSELKEMNYLNGHLKCKLEISIDKTEKFQKELETFKMAIVRKEEELRKSRIEQQKTNESLEREMETRLQNERLVAYLQNQTTNKSARKPNHFRSKASFPSSSSSPQSSMSIGCDSVDDENTVENAPIISPALCSSASLEQFSPSSKGTMGTMRHDIPHRWTSFLVLKQLKCAICLDGLARLRYAFKCTDCHLLVHRQCSFHVLNTCGLPVMCADFFLNQDPKTVPSTQSTQLTDGRMTGWLKFWRSDQPDHIWRSTWASITDNWQLAFFDKENLASNDGSAFYRIDLVAQNWHIHFQARPDDSLKKENVPFLIEIKITQEKLCYRLYLMTPTLQAKRRWLQSLQLATSRRLFRHRNSSLRLYNSQLLRLESPHNLTIHSVIVIDDFLLFGCQEGLFFTHSLDTASLPVNIAGIGTVFDLELVQKADMVVAIGGPLRTVSFVHLGQLRRAFDFVHPLIKPSTVLDRIQPCHLMVSAEIGGVIRYLCIADPENVHILEFNSRLGIFSSKMKVPTVEPATCLLAVDDQKFILGSDAFYSVDWNTGVKSELLHRSDPSLEFASAKQAARQDFPIAALFIGHKELLLAYQNLGICVDLLGNRTRKADVEWARSPLEFAYSSPYLYVVHYESIEIFQVLPSDGLQDRTLQQCNLFESVKPHHIGFGANQGDVLFTSTKVNITDILLFNANDQQQKGGKSLLKRVGISLQRQISDEKRHRS